MAVQMILNSGGAAYLPLTLVHDEINSGRLHRVDGAPLASSPESSKISSGIRCRHLFINLLPKRSWSTARAPFHSTMI